MSSIQLWCSFLLGIALFMPTVTTASSETEQARRQFPVDETQRTIEIFRCATGTVTYLEIGGLTRSMNLDGNEGETSFILRSAASHAVLWKEKFSGRWECLGFDNNTHAYLLAAHHTHGANDLTDRVSYLPESASEIKESAFDKNRFYASVIQLNPSEHEVVFVGGKNNEAGEKLYFLDLQADEIKFPDTIDASVEGAKGELKESWDCPTADAFHFRDGSALAVCGTLNPDPSRPGVYRIGSNNDFYWIVTKNPMGGSRLLIVGGGSGANPAVLKLVDGRHFLHIEVLEDTDRNYSVFQTSIACAEKTCSVGTETCALDIPMTIYPDILQQVKAEKHKTFASLPNGDDYMNLVTDYSHKLLLRALSGDQEAAHVLLHFPFELDAAPAEIVAADQETFDKAKKMKCSGI